ncbi:MAG: serine/threonine-protein kinase [Leptolyngbyaceae cyanobacterium bins.302]|nr:serine/threonine-protein kinase [Leptolyngbyaceae cyanobacterium bins.302]
MTQIASGNPINLAELNTPLDGRYQVVEILSARLWARTYLAQDLHRPSQSECIIHHLKAIPIVPNYAAVMRGLLSREADILEYLGTHDQIPQLLAWFEDDQGFYVVQEFCGGQFLSQELESGQGWSAEAVLDFLHQMLEPLAWVHRHGSIHGNLKPENLVRRQADRKLVLIDFSSMSLLQRAFMAAHGLFVPPTSAAEEGYQPLEQIQGLPCAASDVYAVGMMAVQAWAGMKPTDFQVDPQTIEILWKEHLRSSASPLQQALITVLDNMVQWDVTRRYGNAEQVLLALQDVAKVAPARESVFAIRPVIETAVATAATTTTTATTVTTVATVERSGIEQSGIAEPVAVTKTAIGATLSQPTLSEVGIMSNGIPPNKQTNNSVPPSVKNVDHTKNVDKVATQSASRKVNMKQWLQNTIASTPIRFGASGVAVATTFAAVGWGLLNSVDWSHKTGDLWNRVTGAMAEDGSSNHRTLKARSSQWRKDWQEASVKYQQAETALNQGEWAKAKALATAMPDIPYWRDRGATLAEKISTRTESGSTERLQTAFDYAKERKFTNALNELSQIPANSPVDAVVQAKTKEYREKQNIKAWFDLQQAYNRAIAKDFVNALAFLYQIPEGTEAYEVAQTKIAEYKEKEKIRVKTLLSTADDSTKQQYLISTISSLETVASDAPTETIVSRIEPYMQALNQQAEAWLQAADQQAEAGDTAIAIATLENVPLGTPAYAKARDRILELTAKLHPSATSEPTVAIEIQHESHILSPGLQFRDSQSFIIGRANLQSVD